MSLTYERVQSHLERMKLERVAELMRSHCGAGEQRETLLLDFLDRLLDAEAAARAERRMLAKTRLAHFPFVKTPTDFDFHFQPSIDRKQIQELRCASWPRART